MLKPENYFSDVSFLLVIRCCVKRTEDFHGLIVVRVGLQDLLEALRGVFLVSSIHVHLSQAEERQHEGGRGELGSLVVILKGLVIILLNKKRVEKKTFNASTCLNPGWFDKEPGSNLNVEGTS